MTKPELCTIALVSDAPVLTLPVARPGVVARGTPEAAEDPFTMILKANKKKAATPAVPLAESHAEAFGLHSNLELELQVEQLMWCKFS